MSNVEMILLVLAIMTNGLLGVKLYRLEGQVDILKNVPVLRQYIERYVPVDNSDEAKKRMQVKMAEMEREFAGVFGMDGFKPTKRNGVAARPEDLV